MNEMMNMQGHLTLRLIDGEGNVVHQQQRHNRIVTSGRELVAQLFTGVSSGTPPAPISHMAVGTSNAASVDNQTALVAERSPRKAIAPTDVSYSQFDEPGAGGAVRRVRVRLQAVFDFGDANGTEPLREAGIFNAATAGRMYNRVTFADVTKTNAFKLTLIWEITF